MDADTMDDEIDRIIIDWAYRTKIPLKETAVGDLRKEMVDYIENYVEFNY